MRRVRNWLFLGAIALCAARPVGAAFFINGSGLTDPGAVVTFDGSGLPYDSVVTNQFSGVTISPNLFLLPFLQCNSCSGFADDFVANFNLSGASPYIQPITVQFNHVVSEAAFAFVDQQTSWTFEARLGGTLVESAAAVIPFSPGAGFVGFTGIEFDRIVLISPANSAMGLDNIQYTVVPEPAAWFLATTGLCCWARRRRRVS